MKSFLAAIRFLTILPVPGTWGTAEDDLAHSVPWFPAIGLLLGAAAAVVAWSMSLVAPPMLTAAVTVIVLLSFSGCLHLDGLADMADGLLSSRPRERMLEIMKDSRVGAMGVIAIACILLLKFASLASLPAERLWPAVLLMPLAGRCAIVIHRALLPYARPSGLGNIFYRRPASLPAIGAAGILAATAWCVLGYPGFIVAALCVIAALMVSLYVYRKIGGATGDTFGAVCEIVEIVPALTLAFAPFSGSR
jgi:adenosylcobinamide-GDP ribazoletransferase